MGHVGEGFKNNPQASAWMVGCMLAPPFLPIFLPLPARPGAPSRQPLLVPLGPGSSASATALSSAVPSLTLTSLLCLGFALCASVPVLPLQYVTFILQVISRSFLYGGNAAFFTLA